MIGKTNEVKEATVESLWEDYGRLTPAKRRAFAQRILRDKGLLEDFIDNVLIEKAKRVKGKPITLEEYKASLHKAGY